MKVPSKRTRRSAKVREMSDVMSKSRNRSQYADKPELLGMKWSCGGAHVMFGGCRIEGPNQFKARTKHGAIWRDKKRSMQADGVLEGLKSANPMADPRFGNVRHVYFVRCSARKMDGDNFQAGMKKIRDRVAEYLGTHDGPDGPIEWHYLQYRVKSRGRHDLMVEFFTENGDAAFRRNEPAWRSRTYTAVDRQEKKVVDRHNQRYATNKHFRRATAQMLGRILMQHGYQEAGLWLQSNEWERDYYPRFGRGLSDDERQARAERGGAAGGAGGPDEGAPGEHRGDGEGERLWAEPGDGD